MIGNSGQFQGDVEKIEDFSILGDYLKNIEIVLYNEFLECIINRRNKQYKSTYRNILNLKRLLFNEINVYIY